MEANPGEADQRNQCQERPLGETAAYSRNFAAIANRTVDVVLLEHLNIALGLLGRDFNTRYEGRRKRLLAGRLGE